MTAPSTAVEMRLRYAGRCAACGTGHGAGASALYDRASRSVFCLVCTFEPVEPGVAGASARRENGRRRNARESRIREAHPKIGGFILAVTDDPQSTRAWATGAQGEERVGALLDSIASSTIRVLHDRRIPGSRANIDHIVVCASGVWVIDAKKYQGRPERRVEGGLLSAREEKLVVGGRNHTKLVDGVHKQIDHVVDALDVPGLDRMPVRGMLCFVGADWPLFGGSFVVDEIQVLWPGRMQKLVAQSGELNEGDIDRAYRALASTFLPA